MLYLYLGDRKKIIDAQIKLKNTLHSRRPDAEIFVLNFVNFSPEKLNELIFSQGLFEKKYIVVMRDVLGVEGAEKFFEENLENIQKSENVFIWAEEKIKVDLLKKIEKAKIEIKNLDVVKKEKEDAFNFALADALAQKDKKKLWVLLEKDLKKGVSAEEIHSVLFWQMKNLSLAENTKTASEAGLSSFPYSKAKTNLKKWSKNEVREKTRELLKIYHESREGGLGLDLALEKFVLSF